MGECGCEGESVARLPAREPGKWYVVEVYGGCDNCGAEPALAIYLCDEADEHAEYQIEDAPEVEFGRYGMWATELLSERALMEVWREGYGDKDEDSEVNFAFEEFVRHGLPDAFHRTRYPRPTPGDPHE